MTPTFRFGRVAGIDVGAHWTWLLLPALLDVPPAWWDGIRVADRMRPRPTAGR